MTKHISIAIGFAVRLPDDILEGTFTSEGQPLTAHEVRAELVRMRDVDGLKFIPCTCETQNADGSCSGWTRAQAA